MSYEHVVWAEEILKKIDAEDDSSAKAELILRAKDQFMYLSPAEKADVFVLLLGKNRKVV